MDEKLRALVGRFSALPSFPTLYVEVMKELGADVSGYALEPPTDPSLFVLAGLDRTMPSTIGDIRDRWAMAKASRCS